MGYVFNCPTRLNFSDNAAQDLVLELSDAENGSILVLTDTGLLKAGIAGPLVDGLRGAGFKTTLFTEVPGNPGVVDVDKALDCAKSVGATHLVAIGGGSVIDTAKAVGVLMTHEGISWEDLQWGQARISQPSLPMIAVPTTSGTGSEVTHVAVIGDSKGFKKGVVHPTIFPATALIDGHLSLSLPPHLTAATGMDALVHALEAYLGKRHNPITDLYALAAIRLTARWLPEATRNGQNLVARNAMAQAASLGGIAMDQAGLGLVHSLCGPLAASCHVHHGLGIAVLLPATLVFNAPEITGERWENLCAAIGLDETETADQLSVWAKSLLEQIGLPTRLGELGVKKESIAKMAEDAVRMVMTPNNIRTATAEDCEFILEMAL